MNHKNTTIDKNTQDSLIEEDITQDNRFLTFEIADEFYGIDILSVIEIIRVIKITQIPESCDSIKGIINLRDQIIPVMDIRIRFSLKEKPYNDRTCIIVVKIKDLSIGLIVDTVSEVTEIPESSIEAMPSIGGNGYQQFVRGIGKTKEGVKILLDLNKLLFDEEIEKLKNI